LYLCSDISALQNTFYSTNIVACNNDSSTSILTLLKRFHSVHTNSVYEKYRPITCPNTELSQRHTVSIRLVVSFPDPWNGFIAYSCLFSHWS